MPHRLRPIRSWQLPATPPVPTGHAAALDAALDQELVRSLGALPVLLPILEQLGLREVVNRRCVPAGEHPTDLDPGLVTLLLVLNRLLAPTPLVHVEAWLGETILADLLDIDAAQANDDRLARTLDLLVPHLEALWQDLIVAAIGAFDLDLAQLCYDITSVSFCGDYEDAELVRYGYSRDHRPDRKQLELATTTTVEAGVPIDYRVLAGNVADRTTPVENLARLQHLLALLPPRATDDAPLVISDRAMLTMEALSAYQDSGLHCLGPLDPALGQGAVRQLMEAVMGEDLTGAPLTYRPARADRDPDWVPYHGVQRSLALPHPEPDQPALSITALVVWSPAKARLDAQLRTTQLTTLETALTDLASKLGKRPYTTRTAVEKRVATILRRHPARAYLSVEVRDGTEKERVGLHWDRRDAALAEAARVDGRYVLGTTDPTLDAEAMLSRSKRRDVPEKRFAHLKGPLAVRPVYLHKEDRIQALVFCTMVALLVFSLLELLLQRAQIDLSGRALLAQFTALTVVILVFRDGSQLRRLAGLSPPLADLLHTLEFPSANRYLTPS